ncbi:ATP phosphoribosyltransferase [Mangrovactinospora gilvigrisea]|uniref:ATP phosphoribosyltransferase n=1 Tax=Mangrovactinospora gilvigrisea TaxID=1428644 RepID=A0A1J7BL10_9ACTN|nr:ATP phosphoribosyltransferase [Mangrovactinospora gilvigrisea]OIV39334.1 ATP phosphoribosyltransferase [Mangrovactinospora gilvigrisea]
MLRIAVPNKGSLATQAQAMLHEAGYRQRTAQKELIVTDRANQVEFFYLRPRDIAVYVGSGRLDAGITGRDMLLDSAAAAEEVLALGFARAAFHFAADPGTAADVADLAGKTIATSYPGIVEKHLAEAGIAPAGIVALDGAVETALRLGVAQAIADVVETGTTLRHLGLTTIGEPIMESEAIVVRPARTDPATDLAAERLLRRLRNVLFARDYVLVDYNIEVGRLEAAIALTPGMESPTVSPLHSDGWVAVRAMARVEDCHAVMDRLSAAGARAVLVTRIEACRI